MFDVTSQKTNIKLNYFSLSYYSKNNKWFIGFQTIDVEIELTANHKGRFEMYLCPNNNPKYEATQSCIER